MSETRDRIISELMDGIGGSETFPQLADRVLTALSSGVPARERLVADLKLSAAELRGDPRYLNRADILAIATRLDAVVAALQSGGVPAGEREPVASELREVYRELEQVREAHRTFKMALLVALGVKDEWAITTWRLREYCAAIDRLAAPVPAEPQPKGVQQEPSDDDLVAALREHVAEIRILADGVKSDTADLLDRAIQRLAAGQQDAPSDSGWIPVSERLPEAEDGCHGWSPEGLVALADGRVLTGFTHHINDGPNDWATADGDYIGGVTHWRPIERPEPPKVK